MQEMQEVQEQQEKFDAIWADLSHTQRRFVIAMTQHSSKREAALALDLNPDTVYRWPAVVDEALGFIMKDVLKSTWDILRHYSAQAAFTKTRGLKSKDEKLRQQVATEILNRVIGSWRPHREDPYPEPKMLVVRYVDEGIK